MDKKKKFIIEEKQRLSKSLLWKLQRQFFSSHGQNAWSKEIVPHYITNNAVIAHTYAKLVLSFLRDHRENFSDEQPFYIIEFGAGSGRFGYMFLKKLLLYKNIIPNNMRFCYVLSDFCEANVNAWLKHKQLQPFLEQGLLDVAQFDAEQDGQIVLQHSHFVLKPGTVKNPMIFIGNYFFDTIPQDAFLVKDGKIYEQQATLVCPEPPKNLNDAKILEQLNLEYESKEIFIPYYQENDFDTILQQYQYRLGNTSFMFPNIALECIQRMQKISSSILLISADKGYVEEYSLSENSNNGLVVHGSFSFMVNYHAIGEYVLQQKGVVLRTTNRRNGFNIVAFVLGQQPYLEAKSCYQEFLSIHPDDFFMLEQSIRTQYEHINIAGFIAYIRLYHYDPKILFDISNNLIKQIANAEYIVKKEIKEIIHRVWDLYFYIGEETDMPFCLGMLLYELEYFDEAIKFFEVSLEKHGPNPHTYYNLAMCYYRLRQLSLAFDFIDKGLSVNPNIDLLRTLKIRLENEAVV